MVKRKPAEFGFHRKSEIAPLHLRDETIGNAPTKIEIERAQSGYERGQRDPVMRKGKRAFRDRTPRSRLAVINGFNSKEGD